MYCCSAEETYSFLKAVLLKQGLCCTPNHNPTARLSCIPCLHSCTQQLHTMVTQPIARIPAPQGTAGSRQSTIPACHPWKQPTPCICCMPDAEGSHTAAGASRNLGPAACSQHMASSSRRGCRVPSPGWGIPLAEVWGWFCGSAAGAEQGRMLLLQHRAWRLRSLRSW